MTELANYLPALVESLCDAAACRCETKFHALASALGALASGASSWGMALRADSEGNPTAAQRHRAEADAEFARASEFHELSAPILTAVRLVQRQSGATRLVCITAELACAVAYTRAALHCRLTGEFEAALKIERLADRSIANAREMIALRESEGSECG